MLREYFVCKQDAVNRRNDRDDVKIFHASQLPENLGMKLYLTFYGTIGDDFSISGS